MKQCCCRWLCIKPSICNNLLLRLRGHLQIDFGTLNVIMTLRGEGGSAHDISKFLIKYL